MGVHTASAAAIDWLMEGDPAIRWQTMRDVLGKPQAQWKREQAKVATEGWGRQLLDCRDTAGTWGGGLYTPKWTSTNYTLLLLRDMGLPRSHPAGRESARLLLGSMTSEDLQTRIATLDLCIVGMYLLTPHPQSQPTAKRQQTAKIKFPISNKINNTNKS